MTSLEAWIATQERRSAAALARAISASDLVRVRAAFGQTVRPAWGSVLASPVIADWDPEPDYFFHWVRDAAVAMRAVTGLWQDADEVAGRAAWARRFQDIVGFSLELSRRDGAAIARASSYRTATRRGFRRFLRPPRELERIEGDRLLGEPRFDADGSIDVQRWSRPQFDGPALRALACLGWLRAGGPPFEALAQLLSQDLDFTRRHADRRCIGPWEEPGERAHHYYVALAQLGALAHGHEWIEAASEERRLRAGLDQHWSEGQQGYVAIRGGERLDSAVLLAVLDADLPGGPHSPRDPRVAATLDTLVRLFADLYPVNASRRDAPALGRSADDVYFGGNPWVPTTLAAAELCYRSGWSTRGDGFMATLRDLTPTDGSLSEQLDRTTGRPTSARHLTWSYAAFVNAARARRQPGAGC